MKKYKYIDTYQLSDMPNTSSITCLVCDRTSYHPEDVKRKWCPGCEMFHRTHRILGSELVFWYRIKARVQEIVHFKKSAYNIVPGWAMFSRK